MTLVHNFVASDIIAEFVRVASFLETALMFMTKSLCNVTNGAYLPLQKQKAMHSLTAHESAKHRSSVRNLMRQSVDLEIRTHTLYDNNCAVMLPLSNFTPLTAEFCDGSRVTEL